MIDRSVYVITAGMTDHIEITAAQTIEARDFIVAKVRVLIVDDSRTMRALLRSRLSADPNVEVIGEAADPYEARAAIKELNPDVVTLDIEMPRMNGLEFLSKIMRLRPTPVIMVSTLTQSGAAESVEALSLGAFDVVGKPSAAEFRTAFYDLADKVKAAGRSKGATMRSREKALSQIGKDAFACRDGMLVAIGASTGGVEALMTVLASFPSNCPPTVIAQHMPSSFTQSFAVRLNQNCAPKAAEAYDGAPLKEGHICLAPGGEKHLTVSGGSNPVCRLVDGDLVSGHRPSVDILFDSVAKVYRNRAVGAILTGMGADGAKGMKALRDKGAHTIGQDKSTSIVYGMPRAALEAGGVVEQKPLNDIAAHILRATAVERRAAS